MSYTLKPVLPLELTAKKLELMRYFLVCFKCAISGTVQGIYRLVQVTTPFAILPWDTLLEAQIVIDFFSPRHLEKK